MCVCGGGGGRTTNKRRGGSNTVSFSFNPDLSIDDCNIKCSSLQECVAFTYQMLTGCHLHGALLTDAAVNLQTTKGFSFYACKPEPRQCITDFLEPEATDEQYIISDNINSAVVRSGPGELCYIKAPLPAPTGFSWIGSGYCMANGQSSPYYELSPFTLETCAKACINSPKCEAIEQYLMDRDTCVVIGNTFNEDRYPGDPDMQSSQIRNKHAHTDTKGIDTDVSLLEGGYVDERRLLRAHVPPCRRPVATAATATATAAAAGRCSHTRAAIKHRLERLVHRGHRRRRRRYPRRRSRVPTRSRPQAAQVVEELSLL